MPTAPAALSERTTLGELLAAAPLDDLVATAEGVLAGTGDPVIVRGPELGSIVLTVREPVEATRFHLGDVLVTEVEVEHRGTRGWAMRMGDDALGAVAAAVCDAEVAGDGPGAGDVRSLCHRVTETRAEARRREWAELEPTIVAFEEMD